MNQLHSVITTHSASVNCVQYSFMRITLASLFPRFESEMIFIFAVLACIMVRKIFIYNALYIDYIPLGKQSNIPATIHPGIWLGISMILKGIPRYYLGIYLEYL